MKRLSNDRLRIGILLLLVLIAAARVSAQLHHIQITRSDDYRGRARSQHYEEFTVQARRGSILDRNGRELALSTNTESLYVHPHRTDPEQRKETARLLATVLDARRNEILAKLNSDRPFVWLQRFLEHDDAAALRELGLDLSGHALAIQTEPRRYYPLKHVAAHVLGTTSTDGRALEGVELRFDSILRGDPTVYISTRDTGRQALQLPERHPSDLILTIDLSLQHIVERELDRVMRESGARAATAVFLDPSTGHVLALANRPTLDANHWGRFSAINRRNRAVTSYYEPGSTFKAITMAAALEAKRVRVGESIFCENGYWLYEGRPFRDITPNGYLTPSGILQESSNIGIVKVVSRLDRDELLSTIENLGFGEPTGIELPGELGGGGINEANWSTFSQPSLSFGYEIEVSALQMASAFGAIANDGIRVPPRLVIGSRDHEGGVTEYRPPTGVRVLDAGVARDLQDMLEDVVARGTGKNARIDTYRLAGKTGTARKIVNKKYSDEHHMVSFGGFGPVEQPRLAGFVVVDTPAKGHRLGGRTAAPVFGRILADGLRYLRVPGKDVLLQVEDKTRRRDARGQG